MAVPEQTPFIEYTANGTTTVYPLTFDCDKPEYLIVSLDGEEAPVGSWALTNGSVAFNTAPSNGVLITIERNTPFRRTTEYQSYNNSFRPAPVNKDFDLIWWKLQELGYRDQVIWLALVKEIADRIAGDTNLQNQINTIDDWLENLQQNVNENTSDIAQLVTDLSKEIADRIANDEALKEMFLAMMDEAINDGTINALAITHLDSLEALEGVTNVWDGRTIYIKDLGNYRYDALTTSWVKVYQDADNVMDGSESQMQINDKSVRNFESIADLLTYTPRNDGQVVYVKGYHNPTNFALAKPYVGGGHRVYVASRSAENDGFLCINGWVLQVENNTVSPEHAGAKVNTPSFDSADACQKAINSGCKVQLSGLYYISKPVYYRSNVTINGTGELDCGFIKTTNNTLSFGNITINGKIMNFDVDAAVVAIPRTGDWYSQNNHLSGFTIQYDSALPTKGIGLYAPLIALSTHKSILIKNTFEGVKSADAWMCTWERVQASASSRSFIFGHTGTAWTPNNTTQTFIGCWATDAGLYGWDLNKMQGCTMISCGADFVGADGSPAKALFKLVYSNVTMVTCMNEHLHAQNFLYAEGSEVNIINFNGQAIYNKYKPVTSAWNNNNSMFCVVSNSKVKLTGGSFGFAYNSSNPIEGVNCSALAYVEGGSVFELSPETTFAVPLEEIGICGLTAFTKLGVYYTTNASVDAYVNGVQYRDGPKFLGMVMDSYLSTSGKSLGNENISNLRGIYGNTTLVQSNTANATAANGFPSSGVPYLVQQLSSGAANNSYNVQLAYAISSASGNMWFRTGDYGRAYTSWCRVFHYRDNLIPATTNTYDIGSASINYKNAYFQNAPTVVSDERHKKDVSELSEQEINCAIACGKLYRKYKLKDGDDKFHVGAIAQEVIQCFIDHGLDWQDYGIVIHESWESSDEKEADDIYMVRYDELNSFILAGLISKS
ncbi:tail fiber domain-containing protein [Acinetobacter baumannii]|uniref:tail fiber domain-containing protein n=1 Tax=Acinetobacter baumannii TaxID=470 RepID=UPI0023409150|nr:tail fiber domain-containing protein [Acinetobacter baumannii]